LRPSQKLSSTKTSKDLEQLERQELLEVIQLGDVDCLVALEREAGPQALIALRRAVLDQNLQGVVAGWDIVRNVISAYLVTVLLCSRTC
jgi:hypothetical protein